MIAWSLAIPGSVACLAIALAPTLRVLVATAILDSLLAGFAVSRLSRRPAAAPEGPLDASRAAAYLDELLAWPARHAGLVALVYLARSVVILAVFALWGTRGELVPAAAVVVMCSIYVHRVAMFDGQERVVQAIECIGREPAWTVPLARQALPADRPAGSVALGSETTSLALLWILLLITQGTLLRGAPGAGHLRWAALALGSFGVAMIVSSWALSQSAFSRGVETLVRSPLTGPVNAVPLHPVSTLAQLARVFDRLMQRLRHQEEELSHWVAVRAERQRHTVVSALSASISSSLDEPLATVESVTRELTDRLPPDSASRVIAQRAAVQVGRCRELSSLLDAHLARRAHPSFGRPVGEALDSVLRLLASRFPSGHHRIVWEIDPAASSAKVLLAHADLIHVLSNLLTNACQNLLENEVEAPRIRVSRGTSVPDWVALEVADNGTGMSADEFERLTAFAFAGGRPAPPLPGRTSLGLRLVRRLVERSGGSLAVIQGAGAGTALRVTLPEDRAAPR